MTAVNPINLASIKRKYKEKLAELAYMEEQLKHLQKDLIQEIGTFILEQHDFNSFDQFKDWYDTQTKAVPSLIKPECVEKTVNVEKEDEQEEDIRKQSHWGNNQSLKASSTKQECEPLREAVKKEPIPRKVTPADPLVAHITKVLTENPDQKVTIEIKRNKKSASEYYVNPIECTGDIQLPYLDMLWSTDRYDAKLFKLDEAIKFYTQFKEENPDVPIHLNNVSYGKQIYYHQHKE